MTDTEMEELELLVDKHGLAKLLDMLSDIAYEKAEHIRSNWQDDQTAKVWSKARNRVFRAHIEVERLKL